MEGFELPLRLLEEVRRNPTVENAKRLSDELDNKRSLNSTKDNAILVIILQQISTLNVR